MLLLASPFRLLEPSVPARAGDGRATAIFAGGCLWCLQAPFDALAGVLGTRVGFAGGSKADPAYAEVAGGQTGHAEAIEVVYDPGRLPYEKLLDSFWRNIDPLADAGRYCDHGQQFRTAIFFRSESEKQAAEASKARLEASGVLKGPIVTEIAPAGPFYPAGAEHQGFYKKNPAAYKFYRQNCGRDAGLEKAWGAAPRP